MRKVTFSLLLLPLVVAVTSPVWPQSIQTDGDIESDGRLVSKVATGTAPLAVSSTTMVSNLNADRLDGLDASALALDSDLQNVETLLMDLDNEVNEPTLVRSAESNNSTQAPGGPNGSTVRQIDFRTTLATQRLWYLGTLRWTFQCDASDIASIRVFNTDPVAARIWIRWSQAGSTDANVETVAVPSHISLAVMAAFTDDALATFGYTNANGMVVTGTFYATDSSGAVLSGEKCMVGGTALVTP